MSANTVGRWQAELKAVHRRVPMEMNRKRRWDEDPVILVRHVSSYFVELTRSGCPPIRFAVCRRKGSVTFCDARERSTGTAGTDGCWGNCTPQKPGKSRSLTPTAWVAETSRLIGTERAEEILLQLGVHRQKNLA